MLAHVRAGLARVPHPLLQLAKIGIWQPVFGTGAAVTVINIGLGRGDDQ